MTMWLYDWEPSPYVATLQTLAALVIVVEHIKLFQFLT